MDQGELIGSDFLLALVIVVAGWAFWSLVFWAFDKKAALKTNERENPQPGACCQCDCHNKLRTDGIAATRPVDTNPATERPFVAVR